MTTYGFMVSHYVQFILLFLCIIFKKKYFLRIESNLVSTKTSLLKYIYKNNCRKASKLLYGSLNKEYYINYGARNDQLVFIPILLTMIILNYLKKDLKTLK